MSTQYLKTAIFFGAGASAAEGAPVQDDLFRAYFNSNSRFTNDMDRTLGEFFSTMFGIDVNSIDPARIPFPTFEEILGIIDLAERKKESFKRIGFGGISATEPRIEQVRQYLILLMAIAIKDKLENPTGIHRRLVQNLRNSNLINHTLFITTNYDLLVDNSIASLNDKDPGSILDYGIEFTNFNGPGGWSRPHLEALKLFKLHGSLNWLYCLVCNDVTLTPYEKGITGLINNLPNMRCPACNSFYSPIIVPPTFIKDTSNVYMSMIWNKAEHVLRGVDQIIFCGYSFPDADMNVKYLLKRIQTATQRRLRFLVMNNHPGKAPGLADAEEKRYKRFLGDKVDYTTTSFEEFTINPLAYYRSRT